MGPDSPPAPLIFPGLIPAEPPPPQSPGWAGGWQGTEQSWVGGRWLRIPVSRMKTRAEAPPSALPSLLPSPSPLPLPPCPACSPAPSRAQSVSGWQARGAGAGGSGSLLSRPRHEVWGPPSPSHPAPQRHPPSPELDRTPWDTVFHFLRTSPRLDERPEEVSSRPTAPLPARRAWDPPGGARLANSRFKPPPRHPVWGRRKERSRVKVGSSCQGPGLGRKKGSVYFLPLQQRTSRPPHRQGAFKRPHPGGERVAARWREGGGGRWEAPGARQEHGLGG